MEGLPPGFRFYPTEEELVSFYLHNKLEGRREELNRVIDRIIPVLDIYDYNPWDLPQFGGDVSSRDVEEWFFFIPRQESEARGGRPRRITSSGYWKATGSPGHVYANNRIIGMKRTMVFYRGRAPTGRKTDWKMNEYKANRGDSSSSSISATPMAMHEFTLCRVYKKSKNIRAFDRRPLASEIGDIRSAQPQPEVSINADDHQNLPTTTETANSHESSSSEDRHVTQIGESSNMLMSTDSEPLWDWDQLEWY
ncbi:NAC domain-containing protein 90-like [Mercurialis annua]|uniref:NAC domain-containing protein 90-like n=1 Tax=Mercurialis annua TaxID=3986 RepID=UPI002160B269|nr:NAC domain-containing protein 90-like [Mercurialis annua]